MITTSNNLHFTKRTYSLFLKPHLNALFVESVSFITSHCYSNIHLITTDRTNVFIFFIMEYLHSYNFEFLLQQSHIVQVPSLQKSIVELYISQVCLLETGSQVYKFCILTLYTSSISFGSYLATNMKDDREQQTCKESHKVHNVYHSHCNETISHDFQF